MFFIETAQSQTNAWTGGNTIYRSTASNGTYFDLYMLNPDYAVLSTNKAYFVAMRDFRSSTGLFGSNGTANLRLHTNGNERMRIMNSTGFVGIGTLTPQHNLHLHGTSDYTIPNPVEFGQPPTFQSLGISSRISLTNTTTGSGIEQGGMLLQGGNDLHLWNKANGELILRANGTSLTISHNTNRIWTGLSSSSNDGFGRFNIQSFDDNGLYVRCINDSKTGVIVEAPSSTAAVFESKIYGTSNPINFKVTGGGEVYARKYITTLANFPDYVFSSTYELMPLSELRLYINTNKHLPNVPSAEEIEENGADLGELNRILVEKVEELTLYILEMEERLSDLEGKK